MCCDMSKAKIWNTLRFETTTTTTTVIVQGNPMQIFRIKGDLTELLEKQREK